MFNFLSRLFRGTDSSQPRWIEANELCRKLAAHDTLVLIDVRQPEEFISPPGHLPGAINVPLGEITGRIGELAATRKPIVVVCQTDRRSARAATELHAAGLPDVTVLRGGTAGWHQAGLPLE